MSWEHWRRVALLASTLLSINAHAVEVTLNSQMWCKDSATFCWSKQSFGFGGVRIVADLALGTIFQSGENRFERELFTAAPRFGFEFNIADGWVSLQTVIIAPFTVKLDADSLLVRQGRLQNTTRVLPIDYGYAGGFSFLDGIFSVGWGRVHYDYRQILAPSSNEKRSGFVYMNFNPISTARAIGNRLQ